MPEFDTLIGARDAIAKKKVSSVELTRQFLDRMDKPDILGFLFDEQTFAKNHEE